MIIQRRSFLIGLTSMLAAPAIVRAENIMPVRALGPSSVYSTQRYRPAMRLRGSDNHEYEISFTPDGSLDVEVIKRLCGGFGDPPRIFSLYPREGYSYYLEQKEP